MSKNTHNLYRIHPETWKDLPYTKALEVRIKAAKEAAEYYRLKARAMKDTTTDEYKELSVLYQDSKKALEYNIERLEETR